MIASNKHSRLVANLSVDNDSFLLLDRFLISFARLIEDFKAINYAREFSLLAIVACVLSIIVALYFFP